MKVPTILLAIVAAFAASACGSGGGAPLPGPGKDTSSAQLVITTSITGLELLELDQPQADGEVLKSTGRRIIIIHPPSLDSLAAPFVVSGNTYYFKDLPRGQRLHVNIGYRPAVSLRTGARAASATLADMVFTAVPFELPEGGGTVRITARINISANPAGGYFVDLDTTTSAPGKADKHELTRLYYRDGQLSRDSDSDGQYTDEPRFDDSDCDCVSDQLAEQAEAVNTYSGDPDEAVVGGDLVEIDFETGILRINNITPIASGFPLTASTLELQLSEETWFYAASPPWEWAPGMRLRASLYRFADDGLPVEYWAWEVADASGGGGQAPGELRASDSFEGRVNLAWSTPGAYEGYRLECWGLDPLGVDTWLVWEQELDVQAASYTDGEAEAGAVYIYAAYGYFPGGGEVLIGEDFGGAAPAPGGWAYISGVVESVDGGLLQLEGQAPLQYDEDTWWYDDDDNELAPAALLAGDEVEVLAQYQEGVWWYAAEVLVWMQP